MSNKFACPICQISRRRSEPRHSFHYNMEIDKDVPPLLETSESILSQPSFHESSTNVSVADSAAATQGSESFRDFSDRGRNSSSSSSTRDSDGEEDSFAESASNNSNKPPSETGGFHESDMSSDEDWVEEPCDGEHMSNIKYVSNSLK